MVSPKTTALPTGDKGATQTPLPSSMDQALDARSTSVLGETKEAAAAYTIDPSQNTPSNEPMRFTFKVPFAHQSLMSLALPYFPWTMKPTVTHTDPSPVRPTPAPTKPVSHQDAPSASTMSTSPQPRNPSRDASVDPANFSVPLTPLITIIDSQLSGANPQPPPSCRSPSPMPYKLSASLTLHSSDVRPIPPTVSPR
jgi:hypothetical protein